MDPNTSLAMTVETFPLWASGRRSSRRVPLATTISCCLDPEKLPATAWVIAVGVWRVKLYRCMAETRQDGAASRRRSWRVLGDRDDCR